MRNLFNARIASLLGIIVLVVAVGFSVAACKEDDDKDPYSPEAHRGTWIKEGIALVIEKAQLTVTGANGPEANGEYNIKHTSPMDDNPLFGPSVYEYEYANFGIYVELLGDGTLKIHGGSVPDELQGIWVKLNGTWIDDEDDTELKLDNKTFEISESMKGTYTISGGGITITVTHVHGDMAELASQVEFASQWYTKAQIKEVLLEETFGDETEIDEFLDEIFVSLTGTYSVSGNTLTMTIGGGTTTYTKDNGNG